MNPKEPRQGEVDQPSDVRNSVNEAIGRCDLNSKRHRKFALMWLIFIPFVCAALLGPPFYSKFIVETKTFGEKAASGEIAALSKRVEIVSIASIAICIAITVTMFGMYRFHMGQTVRNEHMELGFHRIRIAARNSAAGFETDVRRSLTDNAFVFEEGKKAKKGTIENPMPGHPAADLLTQLFNQLLERIEIDVRPKSPKS
jgi:hypothetical protein